MCMLRQESSRHAGDDAQYQPSTLMGAHEQHHQLVVTRMEILPLAGNSFRCLVSLPRFRRRRRRRRQWWVKEGTKWPAKNRKPLPHPGSAAMRKIQKATRCHHLNRT